MTAFIIRLHDRRYLALEFKRHLDVQNENDNRTPQQRGLRALVWTDSLTKAEKWLTREAAELWAQRCLPAAGDGVVMDWRVEPAPKFWPADDAA